MAALSHEEGQQGVRKNIICRHLVQEIIQNSSSNIHIQALQTVQVILIGWLKSRKNY